MHYFGNVVFFTVGSLRQDRVGETIIKCTGRHVTWGDGEVRAEQKSSLRGEPKGE